MVTAKGKALCKKYCPIFHGGVGDRPEKCCPWFGKIETCGNIKEVIKNIKNKGR